jgi:hypothetical protein
VVITARSENKLNELAAELQKLGVSVHVFIRGKLYVITGANKIVGILPRLLSHKQTLKIVTNTWKKSIGRA